MHYTTLTKNNHYKMIDDKKNIISYFKFMLQPIVNPRTNKIFAFEFLTKFKNGHIDNELFFKNISNDVIKEIIRHQVNEINRISNEKLVLFSINCSSEVMADNVFINDTIKSLTKKIAFELTTIPTEKYERCRLIKTIRDIKKSGHKIWLDDFLSDEIPRNTLSFADWDIVKFDKSVLYNYLDSPSKMSNFITSLSEFGISRFIFEGVETEYQHYELLRYRGLHQGFLYSKPIEISSLLKVGI